MVGVVDTNNSPDNIDYVIPGNDDAMRAIRLYVEGITGAVLDSKPAGLQLGGSEEGFIEVDESGEIIAEAGGETAAAPKKKAAKKKAVVKKKAAKKVVQDEEVEVDAASADDAESQEDA